MLYNVYELLHPLLAYRRVLWKDHLDQMKFGSQRINLDVRTIPRIRKIVQLISGSTGIVIGAKDGWIASHLNRFYAGESALFVTLYITWNEYEERMAIWSIRDI